MINKHQLILSWYAIYTRERTIIRSVSYRNRYWVYRIESYRLLLYRPILRASLQVHQMLTGPHYTRKSKGVQAPCHPPAARARAPVHAVLWSMIRENVGGEGSGRRLCHGEAGIRLQRQRSTGLGHHHAALPPPAGSDNNSQLSITLTFLLINQS